MKKIMITSLLLCMGHVYAEGVEAKDNMALSDGQKNRMFTERGLPLPGEPPKVVPARTMGKMGQKAAIALAKRQKSFASRGYAKEDNYTAMKLLADKDNIKKDVAANLNNTDPAHTHMRANIQALKMGYEYKGAPEELVDEVLGFSPWGAFAPGKAWDGKGWTGAAEFFVPKGLPDVICIYNEMSIKLTGTTATLFKEVVSDRIHGKISVVDVTGNEKTAFSYKADWWDNIYRHELECVEKTYSQATASEVISLALAIDKSI